ncbi:hypothetical protein [Chondromyces apiculatus]|uniref:Uncharacterized protein n=1 Tax=Chondromyces apiculatus DSM 436 TaxID=1192034 RepID=A0A017TF36_9BACT|nr:hypothetical protein [Chondromyces apiculatus]EYF07211.1 Hypothetical protein CAP_0690 [Chondromyces apiculatus DSM 436]
MSHLSLLREYFGDVDEEAFIEGSALVGNGEGDGEPPDAPDDDGSGGGHPEWEPLEPEPEEQRAAEPEPEDPPPEPVPRAKRAEVVHMGTRQVARSAEGVVALNTLEVLPPFEFSV